MRTYVALTHLFDTIYEARLHTHTHAQEPQSSIEYACTWLGCACSRTHSRTRVRTRAQPKSFGIFDYTELSSIRFPIQLNVSLWNVALSSVHSIRSNGNEGINCGTLSRMISKVMCEAHRAMNTVWKREYSTSIFKSERSIYRYTQCFNMIHITYETYRSHEHVFVVAPMEVSIAEWKRKRCQRQCKVIQIPDFNWNWFTGATDVYFVWIRGHSANRTDKNEWAIKRPSDTTYS